MQCKKHRDAETELVCCSCGQPACTQCQVNLGGRIYCKECIASKLEIEAYNAQRPMKKSKFFTFIFGVVPGAAHMYLGLINKGLSLMILFFAALISTIIAAQFLYIEWLIPTLIAPFYIICACYSVFDSLTAADRINSGALVEDCSEIRFSKEYMLIKNTIIAKKRTIGAVMMGIGIIGIFNLFARTINNIISTYLNIGFNFSHFIAPTILVVLGVLLIRRGSAEV